MDRGCVFFVHVTWQGAIAEGAPTHHLPVPPSSLLLVESNDPLPPRRGITVISTRHALRSNGKGQGYHGDAETNPSSLSPPPPP
eukprot:3041893-Rhodomonas_salina.1